MEPQGPNLLQRPLVIINVGLVMFFEAMESQGLEAVQVDWLPPAGGDKTMADLLDRLI